MLFQVHTEKRNELSATLVNNLAFIQFNARLLNNQNGEEDENDNDVLSYHDATKAQQWILDGIDEEEEEGESEYRRCRAVRELYDDFESEDEEANENKVKHESDG